MGATTVSKICRVCRVDVSSVKRFKDQHGNYYCGECWGQYQHAPEPSSDATTDTFPCHVCRRSFPVSEVYSEPDGQTICKSCWQSRTAPRQRTNRELPEGLELVGADEPRADAGVLPGGLELIEDESPAAQASALPGGLELLDEHDPLAALATIRPAEPPPVAPPAQRPAVVAPPPDQFFCETCNLYFPRKQLVMSADGSVQCTACARERADAAREKLKQQQRIAAVAKSNKAKRNYAAASDSGGGGGVGHIIFAIICIVGGMSGTLVLRGTNSPGALIAFGFLYLLVGIYKVTRN